MTLRVALDHNFPVTIVDAIAPGIVEAEIVPISRIDKRLARLDDHELVRAVWIREFDLLVSCDHDMFAEPLVVAAILQTRMSVVAALGQGHDRVAAAGLVLAHLPHIAALYRKDEAQIWKLRIGRQKAFDPWADMERIAGRQRMAAQALYASLRVAEGELARDPVEDLDGTG